MWSKHHLGYVAPRRYYSQRYVVTLQVREWIKAGYTDAQIALLYNHPASGGKTCSKGYNAKQDVEWDSCAYRDSFLLAIKR